jgi:hypothetical protein
VQDDYINDKVTVVITATIIIRMRKTRTTATSTTTTATTAGIIELMIDATRKSERWTRIREG